ncbi:acyl-CoA thioesterase [Edaphobacter albus]|uniref:acyl-CoA thioesterase n=1 Tax=Edaphobacter sp. 4G125 TaxID=2763071 RepID=UPI00164811FE|nr:thioesterase family protein [Edaphobacter sp. 4G125]QNI37905.1 acyl-CoA thioesterase [Edaphobacter sp. 4G125]
MSEGTSREPVISESRLRVRYAETDQMGVVYHANYLVWFEVGRVDFIRTLGMDYRSMEREDGLGIAVVDVSARYKSPARYDDELIVETRLLAARGPVIKFGYRIVKAADRAILCEGETVHVVVGKDMQKRTLPEKYAKRFAEVLIR